MAGISRLDQLAAQADSIRSKMQSGELEREKQALANLIRQANTLVGRIDRPLADAEKAVDDFLADVARNFR